MFYLKRGSSIVWDLGIFYILDMAKIVFILLIPIRKV